MVTNSWEKLLSWQRLGKDILPTQDPARSQFQMDYDRLVFCSAFRRLQDKTQVVPLPQTDYVRTRLTHSLEVSCIARTLGALIGKIICAREKSLSAQIAPTDFGAICSAAALAHDLGNPPFGHSGEDAIRHWFRTSRIAQSLHGMLSPEQFADIDRYEGNAQGFRIVTRLQMPDNPGGMQLTYAVLGAFTKYPRPSRLPSGFDAGWRRSMKKFGFFSTESDAFVQVAQGLGLKPLGSGVAAFQRHPLAFVTEAADDISYRVIDFEDGFRLGLIDFATIRRLFGELAGSHELAKAEAKIASPRGVVEYLRARAINRLVEQVVEVFVQNEDAIIAGEYDRCLIEDIPASDWLSEIQNQSAEFIYRSATNLEVELAGFEVIGDLLDRLVGAIEEVAQKGKAAAAPSRKLLQLIPAQFVGPDHTPHPSVFERLIKILDYVSGMTDSYAVSLHKKLVGIRLPVR